MSELPIDKKRKAAAALLPPKDQVTAEIIKLCARLGRESFSELKRVAREQGVPITERISMRKDLLCGKLATKLGLGALQTMVDATEDIEDAQDLLIDTVSLEPLDDPVEIGTGRVYSRSTIDKVIASGKLEDPESPQQTFTVDQVVSSIFARRIMEAHWRAFGNKPEEFSEKWAVALESGDAREVARLLPRIQDVNAPVMHRLPEPSTPLMIAISTGKVEVVSLLLAAAPGGIDVNKMTGGLSPLFLATHPGYVEMVTLLLAMPGIDVNQKTNSIYSTALHAAVRYQEEAIVALLVAADGINANVLTHEGDTPLGLAIYQGNANVLALLLTAPGIDVNKVSRGSTPLALAVKYKDEAMVTMLLAVPGIDVNNTGWWGKSPLVLAIETNAVAIYKLLQAMPGIDVGAGNALLQRMRAARAVREGGPGQPPIVIDDDSD